MNEFKQDDFEEYLKVKAMSSSQLAMLARSAHEYEYYQKNPKEQTKSMGLGKMIHSFILEPEKFTEIYAVAPNIADYPKAIKTHEELKQLSEKYGLKKSGKKEELINALRAKDSELEFWDDIVKHFEGSGKKLLTQTEYKMLLGISNSIKKHSMIKKILADGIPEISGYWFDEEYKINCKMRADWVTEKGYIVDLKTTTRGDARSWSRKLVEYRYDIQAAWYSRGYEKIKGTKPKGFIHFIIESSEPYCIYTYLSDNTVLECGETGGRDTIGYKQAIDLYLKCSKEEFWPMPQTELEIESMPDYFI